jgi:hypothetical protein
MTNTYYAADVELQDFRRYRQENAVGQCFTVVIAGQGDSLMWRLTDGSYEGVQQDARGESFGSYPFSVTVQNDTAVCFSAA